MDTAPGIDNKGRLLAPDRSFSDWAAGFPMIRIDDILAALLLSLFMFRRLEVLTVRVEDNTHLPPERLEAWRKLALHCYTVGAVVCAAKVVLSLGWFWLFVSKPSFLIWGGLAIFAGWVIGLVWCWRQATEANALRVELQIQRRPPPPKPPRDAGS